MAKYECVLDGPALKQGGLAEPLAKNGEICLSPQAWECVKDYVVEGPLLEEHPDFHLLQCLDESMCDVVSVQQAITKSDDRAQLLDRLRPSDLSAIRQYVPSGVLDAYGAPICINEMRDITTVFISSLRAEMATVQELVASVQRSCDIFGGHWKRS